MKVRSVKATSVKAESRQEEARKWETRKWEEGEREGNIFLLRFSIKKIRITINK